MFIWLLNTSCKDNMRKIKKTFIAGICFIAILVNQNVCFAAEGNEPPLDMASIYNEYKNDQQYLLMLENYGRRMQNNFWRMFLTAVSKAVSSSNIIWSR